MNETPATNRGEARKRKKSDAIAITVRVTRDTYDRIERLRSNAPFTPDRSAVVNNLLETHPMMKAA